MTFSPAAFLKGAPPGTIAALVICRRVDEEADDEVVHP
jgi:hypothetical protein